MLSTARPGLALTTLQTVRVVFTGGCGLSEGEEPDLRGARQVLRRRQCAQTSQGPHALRQVAAVCAHAASAPRAQDAPQGATGCAALAF